LNKQPFAPIDFNKYASGDALKSIDKFGSENVKPDFSKYASESRGQYTPVETAGAFERASPVPQLPLGYSRTQSSFSNHGMLNKSPTNSSYQQFNVSQSRSQRSIKQDIPTSIPKPAPKSNYF
jgi:hypothetical protein